MKQIKVIKKKMLTKQSSPSGISDVVLDPKTIRRNTAKVIEGWVTDWRKRIESQKLFAYGLKPNKEQL